MLPETLEVDTSTTKEVTVLSLIRDVSVEACICDLIDNAIDAASALLTSGPCAEYDEFGMPASFDGYIVELEINARGTLIRDNCGGMTSEQFSRAVRFGNLSDRPYGIGLYGIGLNRAVFKLGERVSISSTSSSEHLELSFRVSEYLKNQEVWTLPATRSSPEGKSSGTEISIQEPSHEVVRIIGNGERVENFKKQVAEIYYRFIQKGLVIKINTKKIEPHFVDIRKDSPFPPMRISYHDGDVFVDIVAGQHEKHKFSAEPGHKKIDNDKLTNEFGWTVVCNDRPVILCNRESVTGWTGAFHTQFYGFVGYVRFYARDGRDLPWNTSKTGVDVPNAIYQNAIIEMAKFAKMWRKYSAHAKKVQQEKGTLLPYDPQNPPLVSPDPDPTPEPAPAPPTNPKPRKLWAVLPDDIDTSQCSDKLRDLVTEAQAINMKHFRYSGLALIRMLFEIAATDYLISTRNYKRLTTELLSTTNAERAARGLPNARKSDLKPGLKEITDFLVRNPSVFYGGMENYIKESLNSFVNRKATLNSALHHHIHRLGLDSAIGIRDELLPILRYLIERKVITDE